MWNTDWRLNKLLDGVSVHQKIPWQIGYLFARLMALLARERFATPADLIADTVLSYDDVSEGDTLQAGPYRYTVAADDATDYHLTTSHATDPLKLYAEPEQGVISTEQLGWSDDDDVTTDLIRFWPRFNEGETLLFCHNVNCGFVQLTMPAGFTMAAKKPQVDGINFTTAAFNGNSNPKFRLSDHCSVTDMRFTSDVSATNVTGMVLGGGEDDEAKSLVGASIRGIYLHVAVNLPIRMYNSYQLVVDGCEFRDGQYFLQLNSSEQARITNNVFNSDTAIRPNHEHLKLGQTDINGNVGMFISGNEFIRSARDGIDCTGAMIDSVVERNRFIACGGWTDGASGVGFGGMDIKSDQQERADPEFRNFNITIRENYFEDSHISCVSLWGHEGGSWTDPTDDEILAYTTSEIVLHGNTFIKTGNNSLRSGFGSGTGGNFSLFGDTFLGGASISGGAPQSLVARDIHLELVGDDLSNIMDFEDCENLDLDFRLIETREPIVAGTNYIPIRDSSNIRITAKLDIRHEGLDYIFSVNGTCSDISISLTGQYTGGGAAPTAVYLDTASSGTNHDGITVHDCDLRGFDHVFRTKVSGPGDPATNVSILNNRHIAGDGALIDFMTLSNASDVGGITIVGSRGDGTTDLWTGTTTSVVWDDVSGNSEFTSSQALSVADLPAGYAEQRMFVNDATATTFWSVVAGSGSNTVPVIFDGTDWRVG